MTSVELLKASRDQLLGLHKSLVDFERSIYEGINGPMNSGQFLNVLLEDRDFAWLRKFSVLIVEIDEMFAQRDGFQPDQVEVHLEKLRDLVEMRSDDEDFVFRYRAALQQDTEAAGRQGSLRKLLADA